MIDLSAFSRTADLALGFRRCHRHPKGVSAWAERTTSARVCSWIYSGSIRPVGSGNGCRQVRRMLSHQPPLVSSTLAKCEPRVTGLFWLHASDHKNESDLVASVSGASRAGLAACHREAHVTRRL